MLLIGILNRNIGLTVSKGGVQYALLLLLLLEIWAACMCTLLMAGKIGVN